jgi:1,2-diacylglycerol-3-alpha-glucose alpha-1,2-glucosyltransferase
MKILLYRKNANAFKKSGIGRAMKHQEEALTQAGVTYTTNAKEDYDLVHINTVDPQAIMMAKKAKKHGKKVVYHAHSTKEDFQNSFMFSNQLAPAFKRLIMYAYNQADYLITPTPYSKKILEGYGITLPIEDVSNGIDLSRFTYNQQKVDAFRAYFNLNKDQKVIISVGLYFQRKGLPDFMEVARTLPDYTFIWFGYTPPASVTKEVRNAIKHKPSNVHLPGYIAGDIIEGAFASADIFFFPSYEETEGIVVLEALASKCQVVVRDIGVYDGWLFDKENCYKGINNQQFATLIRDLINNDLPDTIENGYKVAKERSIKNIGYKLKALYERALSL